MGRQQSGDIDVVRGRPGQQYLCGLGSGAKYRDRKRTPRDRWGPRDIAAVKLAVASCGDRRVDPRRYRRRTCNRLPSRLDHLLPERHVDDGQRRCDGRVRAS